MQTPPRSFVQCYIAFLDLLGIKTLVERCESDRDLYNRICCALEEVKKPPSFRMTVCQFSDDSKTTSRQIHSLQVQAFSDCVLLFAPVSFFPPSWIASAVARFIETLMRLGIAVRGSMSVGDMHWNENWGRIDQKDSSSSTAIAFGPGLIEAYRLENSVAIYPRVIICEKFYQNAEHGIQVNTLGKGKLTDYFRQDFDGRFHLDILHPEIIRRNKVVTNQYTHESLAYPEEAVRFDHVEYCNWMTTVKSFIEENLKKCENENVRKKYNWYAQYYNEYAFKYNIGDCIDISRDTDT